MEHRTQPAGHRTWNNITVASAAELLDGLNYKVEAYSVASNFATKIARVACSTPSVVSDEADCSRLVIMLEQDAARVTIGPHHRRRPVPTHDTINQISFSPPGARQWGFFDHRSDKLRWMVLQFDRSFLAERLREDFDAPEFCPRYMFHDPEIYQAARYIEASCLQDEPLTALQDDMLALTLLRSMARYETKTVSTRVYGLTPQQRRRLADYMRARLSENVQLNELADQVCLSPAHFCRAFKASVGVTPHAWQLRERIRAAQAVLANRSVTLADAAIAVGFFDQAHFTRIFKRIVGISPGVWRSQRYK